MRLDSGTRGRAGTLRSGLLGAAIAAVALLAPAGASAATISVTTTTDEFDAGNRCSLREAIWSSNNNSNTLADGCVAGSGTDLILVRPGVHNLTRLDPGPSFLQEDADLTGDLDVTAPVNIVNDRSQGVRPVTIDGPGSGLADGRVFHVLADGVLISGLGVRGGGASEEGSNEGGGILNAGTLTVRNSAIYDNSAVFGGGISSDGTSSTTIINSTIARNSAFEDGGGTSVETDGIMSLRGVTVAQNTADADSSGGGDGGGVAVSSSGAGGTLTLRNTLLAGNVDRGREAHDCVEVGGSVTSLGRTFIGNPSGCSYTAGSGDVVNRSARLLSLQDNGGFTPTIALRKTSPAINRGAACVRTDQRGVPRRLGGRCDIGAWELARCRGVVINRVGTGAGERLDGTTGPDGILALGGHDFLFGFGGKDGLCGGNGPDRLEGGPADDQLDGGRGRDACFPGPGRDRVIRCELPRRR